MNTLNICPCCSNSLIHHFGNDREYWFCRHCWSEMPNLKDLAVEKKYVPAKIVNLSAKLPTFRQPILTV